MQQTYLCKDFDQYFLYDEYNIFDCRGGVVVERSPRERDTGVRSTIGTDLFFKTTSDSSIAKRSTTGENVIDPRR